MNEPDDLDALLKARFDSEHRLVPEEPFVASTMQRIRAGQQQMAYARTALRIAALVAVVLASPWLIEGAARLNAVLASSLAWAGQIGYWALGAVAIMALLVSRARSR